VILHSFVYHIVNSGPSTHMGCIRFSSENGCDMHAIAKLCG
jgi:hypothetical protein